ncbi:unnamed protein product, partial [Meganyctiphanes norvegica]
GFFGPSKFCPLREVEENLNTMYIGLGLPRNSPLAELFNDRIMWLVATGHLGLGGKLLPAEGSGSDVCKKAPPEIGQLQAFKMDQMAGAFFLWLAGIILAFSFFIVEVTITLLKGQK